MTDHSRKWTDQFSRMWYSRFCISQIQTTYFLFLLQLHGNKLFSSVSTENAIEYLKSNAFAFQLNAIGPETNDQRIRTWTIAIRAHACHCQRAHTHTHARTPINMRGRKAGTRAHWRMSNKTCGQTTSMPTNVYHTWTTSGRIVDTAIEQAANRTLATHTVLNEKSWTFVIH